MKHFSIVILAFFSGISSATSIHLHKQLNDELLITDTVIVVGVGTPAEGPYDIHIVNGKIKTLSRSSSSNPLRKSVKNQINATGSYTLPGFINMHAHIMYQRAGIDMPQPYQYNLWLASGITTVRDLGSDLDKASEDKRQSSLQQIVAPRIFLYPGIWGNHSKKELEKKFKAFTKKKVDGVKFGMMDKETFYMASKLAKKHNLPVANHVGVEDMNAWDNITAKTRTIEHWYGVPDAALKGVQSFPADMNYSNELHRFRYAGRLWRETDSEKLDQVLGEMVKANVAWNPTLVIYEASRDLQRATSSPWYQDYLHPGLEKFFQPSAESHGSFFWGWTSTDETFWKENYQIWFKALRAFEDKGGVITTGEDGGYIYQLFGFGYLRELLLQQEAGFQPLEVIKHATVNSANVLGEGHHLGQVKEGYTADLVIVNGNPLADLYKLFPRNIRAFTGDDSTGGVLWTIKNGTAFHAPTLLKEVREMVKKSRNSNQINYLVKRQ